jgi:hypothetical protein
MMMKSPSTRSVTVVLLGFASAWLSASALQAQQPVSNSVKAHLKSSGRTITVEKTLDPRTGIQSSGARDEAGVPVDYFALLRKERELAAEPPRKLVSPLPERLAEAGGAPVIVGVWVKFDPKNVDFRTDYHRQLEDGVKPDVARAWLVAQVAQGNLLAIEGAVPLLATSGAEIIGNARFAPLVFVLANAAQVEALSALDVVQGLYANVTFRDTTDDAIATHRWNRVHNYNIRGDGVRVAVLEDNGIDDAACVSNILNVVGWANANHNIQDHPTGSASVIGSMNSTHPGHARGIEILSANGTTAGGAPSYNTNDIIAASDWAIGQGADVVNCSFGFNNTPLVLQMIDRYVDYQVRFTTVTFAVSAGNNGGVGDDVSSPGVAYNCITVGAIDDANTPQWSDDIMASYSSFDDPTSTHGDREKPEVAAEGTNMDLLDLGCAFTYFASGTSFAAPGVAGMCGALMQMDSTLRSWPEAMKAIMMAAGTHNLEGSSRLSDVDGAGGMNGLQAYNTVAGSKYYIGSLTPSSFTTNGYFTRDIYLQGGDKTRVVLVWDSLASGPAAYATDVLDADLDIAIYQGAGQTSGVYMGGSASWDNPYEIAEFCPPTTGWYTVAVNDFRFDGTSEYYAIAWTQQADGRYAHYRQWFPESVTSDLSGPTIGNPVFYLDPIDFANGGKGFLSVVSGGVWTGIDLPGACRHSYGDYDWVTNLLLDSANPYFLNFLGTWSGSGTTFSHYWSIPDDPGIVGIPLYHTLLTLDGAAPDGILELGQVERLMFWSHATDLPLSDDGWAGPINIGFNFPFYGGTHSQVYINANGNLTFGGGDFTWTESVAAFNGGLPRIAPFFDDLNATLGGKIRYRTAGAQQFIVEWVNVPEHTTTNQNSVLCILNADGTIEFKYRDCAMLDGLVGISPGSSAGTTAVDFSHGWVEGGFGDAIYQQFTGAADPFDLDVASSWRSHLRFHRLSANVYRATFETP